MGLLVTGYWLFVTGCESLNGSMVRWLEGRRWSGLDKRFVNGTHDARLVSPGEFLQNARGFGFQLGGKRLLAENRQDAVGHFIRVPEVDFERVIDHFARTGLSRQYDWNAVGNRFKMDQAERLGERGHDEAVRLTEERLCFALVDLAGEDHR